MSDMLVSDCTGFSLFFHFCGPVWIWSWYGKLIKILLSAVSMYQGSWNE